MGKAEDEQHLPGTAVDAQGIGTSTSDSNGCCLSCIRIRCVFALVLGAAVLLSGIFWLPIFQFGDQEGLDLEYGGHDIVASFMLKKPTSFLKDSILLLEGSIFEEMSFSNTKVEIISLETLAVSNITKVVFSVESDVTTQSLIRESFVSLITHQSILYLNASLFGDPFSFEVLKFRGGITVSPEQKAFLLQSAQILFNFTLNFSIDQTMSNFYELKSQLKAGLDLAPYENLYSKVTNLKGSTVARPVTVQSEVLLAVGINPSESRLKQLAQTITGSHTKNLGLNNTVFGRVKEVRLSSILQHSLGSDISGPSPSPLPLESHHHRQHHHRHSTILAPSISPSPSMGSGGSIIGQRAPTSAPVPAKKKATEPPACHFGYKNKFPWKHNKQSALHIYPPHAAPPRLNQPEPMAPKMPPVPAETPLNSVAYAHSQPPSKGVYHARPPDMMPLASPSPSPSSSGVVSSNIWALPLFVLLTMHL